MRLTLVCLFAENVCLTERTAALVRVILWCLRPECFLGHLFFEEQKLGYCDTLGVVDSVVIMQTF